MRPSWQPATWFSFALSGSPGQLQSSINIKIMIKVEIMCHVWELYWQP
jgi:hypothetical protein